MATLDDIAVFVATACSLTVGTTLFKGAMPATPDACASLQEYGGLPPVHVFGQAGIASERPRLQVTFRGAKDDYATPRATAETAYRAFAAASAQAVNGTRVLAMSPLQPPFKVREDENGRIVIGFNVEIDKELSA